MRKQREAMMRHLVSRKKRKLDGGDNAKDHPPLLRLDAIAMLAQSCLTTSTLKVNIKQKKLDAALKPKPQLLDVHVDPQTNFDPRTKRRRPTLMLFGELQAKPKAKDINPNLIDITKEDDVEWWDVPFLRNSHNIITIYVEHPRPIQPPPASEPPPPTPQPLKLTKQERKKLRTQTRLAREGERQQMIRLGVLDPPKPRLKMNNFIKLGLASEDPTKLEMEVRKAAAEREQAHVDRNIARKLTPAERSQKKATNLFGDHHSSNTTLVSVYKINADLSRHPQARFKLDINAQQNRLTGCAAMISDKATSVVVVEGCNKSIHRYDKLMLKRIIDWTAEDDDREKPWCVQLVWQGSVGKPNFSRFMVQGCTTEAAARKIFSDHGVAHYWDLALALNEDHHSP